MIACNVKYIPPAHLCIVSTPDGRRAAIQGIDSREAAEAAAAEVAARWEAEAAASAPAATPAEPAAQEP